MSTPVEIKKLHEQLDLVLGTGVYLIIALVLWAEALKIDVVHL